MGSLHGLEIDSDVELRRLSPVPGALGTVTVRAAAGRPLDRSGELLHLVVGASGEPAYALAREGGHLLSWHADSGSFLIDAARTRIEHRTADSLHPTAASTRWEDRLGSTAVPLLAGERGRLALHASAVAVGEGAVLICGVTGRGKSTLAAALAARGHDAVAEDGVVVGGGPRGHPEVWPGLAGALITPAAAAAIGVAGGRRQDPRGRVLVPSHRNAEGSVPVVAVAILLERSGDRVALVEPGLGPRHRELLAHVVNANRRGPAAFAASARLVERVPVALLTVPDSIDAIGDAATALEGLAERGSRSLR